MYEELKFIGGHFFDYELPKDKQYLFKYFRGPAEEQFLRYLYCFGNYDNFRNHTGFYYQNRWFHILRKRHDMIVSYYENVRHEISQSEDDEMDLGLLMQIEKGKIKISTY